ncbi:MAG: transglutaminase domain-containing protein [Anaerolineae bacterium]|nr:MAG: transglutaminase domain-containing protein [Anaerolineae bacterium]
MDILVLRLLKRIRPRDGWLVFVLIWAALLSVAAGIQEARWVPGEEYRHFFTGVALAAGFVGLWLAKSRLAGWAVGLVGGLGGVVFVVSTVGRVLPPGVQLAMEVGYLGQWLRRGWSEKVWGQVPFQPLLADSWARLTFLSQRLVEWWTVVRAGGVSRDNAPFLLLAGLVLWTASVFVMWGVYRWRRPLTGLLPVGAILAVSLYHSGEGLIYLLTFLASGTFLVPWMRFATLAESWEARGVDYSPEVRFDVAVLGLALAGAVALGAILLPSVSIPQVARWVWEHGPGTWQSDDDGLDRAFGGIRRPYPSGRGGIPVGAGGLPRAHLLGGSVDLARQPIMAVSTDDPPLLVPYPVGPEEIYDVPKYYWRAQTYDRYTGRGWENETADRVRYKAGESLPGTPIEGRRELRQGYSFFVSYDGAVYAAGEPLRLDISFSGRWRAPDDLVGLEREPRVKQYNVVSLVPDVDEDVLRGAPADYPAEMAERYLQLPDAVPQRVLDLAHDVTAELPTPYDKTLALQIYLRQFDYSLELEPPPLDVDVVDYFLFDVQTGYCDYFASAMVVMARAVGLPARLAVGYASGTYDVYREYYHVVEADAHSWPEIYFPSYGWIEFEPTAARTVFEREGIDPVSDRPVLPPPPRSPARRSLPAKSILRQVGLLLGGLVLWQAWRRWPRLASMSSPALMAVIYGRLARQGARLGVPMRPSDTPGEYGSRLAAGIARRVERPRWGRGTLAGQAQDATADLATLEQLYLRATYSRHRLTEDTRRAALSAWRRLSSRLWLIWLGGKAMGSVDKG